MENNRLFLDKRVPSPLIKLLSFGRINGGVESVFKALQQVVGDKGTLVFPTYTLNLSSEDVYNPDTTPSYGMGALSEYVRKIPGVLRSNCPMHNHCALGPLAEIASKHNILPQNLVNWKKTFLANAEIAMEPSKAVKEYKEELIKSQEQNERLTALVGKVTVEKEWLAKKLKSLGSSKLKQLIDLKPAVSHSSSSLPSVNHQCQLLGINRSGLYYKPRVNHAKQIIKNKITKVFEQIPIYGEKKVHKQLLEDGVKVSLNTVARYRQELGLKAVLAVKQVNTTMPIKEHKKYSYKLCSGLTNLDTKIALYPSRGY